MTTNQYEQINWGWLNDYSGYKFAPITFFENIYTKEGRVFENQYNQMLDDLSSGAFVVGAAKTLVTVDSEKGILPYNTSSTKPIYFSEGMPKECDQGYIEIDLYGNINYNKENPAFKYDIYTVQAGIINTNTLNSADINNTNEINTKTLNSSNINSDNIINQKIIKSPVFEGLTGGTRAQFKGNADTATKLDGISVGNNHLPVYFNNGVPTVCNNPTQENDWTGIPYVTEDEKTLDIGCAIIFNDNNAKTFLFRPETNSTNQVTLELPSKDGQIALTTDTTPVKIIKTTNTATKKYFTTATGAGSNDNLYYYEEIYAETEPGDNGKPVLMGAAWNDYAEYRNQQEEIEPGYCVYSNDDGLVNKTTKRLQPCDGIVSDTFGFAIGKTKIYKTPLAVAGRVLAYCEDDRNNYHAGDVVCAGPEGKVSKMTREEIKEYPDRIVGIVSEIPNYEKWNNKKVNNRIWIKVK